MIKMSHIATVLLFASISVAHAADTAKQPVSQGAASVSKNLAGKPDNKGLQTASEQLKENEAKVAEKRATAEKTSGDAKHKKDKHDGMAKTDKADHDKMDRPAKAERPAR